MLFTIFFAALASDNTELTWDISIKGVPLGTRSAKIKRLPGDTGARVIESWTELEGKLGTIPISFRQRLTAHAEGENPASFSSVLKQDGEASEIQGRWTSSGWMVSTNIGGRHRTSDYPLTAIDRSTPDLMDPESRLHLKDGQRLRLLSDISGEVWEGTVEALGSSEIRIASEPVEVLGYRWTGPQGTSMFFFSTEGYLVQYTMPLMGVPVKGVLTAPPPGGSDDFPVASERPTVEILPL